MRRPVKQNTARRQVAVERPAPAPFGGWDTESPIANMKQGFAVLLDNWIPRNGRVELRRGFIDHVTGTSDPVEALIAWRGDAAGDKIFACAGTDIYDVTTAGGLPSAAWASATSAQWKYTNFANDAGAFAIAANGVDVPLRYNGTDWAELTITGTSGPITLTSSNLADVMSHKRRLWFLEKNTLRVWFLPVNAIQGAAELLDLGPIFYKGGRLVAQGTWSLDGGAGMDDVAAFFTSEGQVAIYQGLDPTDADNWSLVGVFDLSKPLGSNSLVKWGADLAILTIDGLLPLSQALNKDRDEAKKIAITSKITSAFGKAAMAYGSNFGWSTTLYGGRGGLVVVNVPVVQNGAAHQYVQSIETGAWCRYTGWDAICFASANGGLYFGAELGVYQADTGSSDNSEIIYGDLTGAFSRFGYQGSKQFTMIQPLLKAPSIIKPAIEVLTDYRERVPTAVPTVIAPGDIGDDDEDEIRYDWTSATGNGLVGAPRLRVGVVGSGDSDRLAIGDGFLLLDQAAGDHILTRSDLPLDVDVSLIGFNLMFIPGGPL